MIPAAENCPLGDSACNAASLVQDPEMSPFAVAHGFGSAFTKRFAQNHLCLWTRVELVRIGILGLSELDFSPNPVPGSPLRVPARCDLIVRRS